MTTIREKGYAHWDGTLIERKFPWWPITRTGIRLAFQKKKFRFFFAISFMPAIVFLAGIYISERLEDFKFMIQNSEKFIRIDPGFFKLYFTNDALLFMMVMVLVFSGAGLIADDLKHNALQIYFCRPLGKKDYFMGKAAVVFFFVLLLTLVPGLILLIMKLVFSGSFKFLVAYPALILSIIGDSALLTIFFGFYALLMSALTKNRRYATILIFAVYIFSDVIFAILFDIFRSPYAALFSLKGCLQQAGAVIFGQRLPFDYPGYLSFLILFGICALSAIVLRRRIRGVEVIK